MSDDHGATGHGFALLGSPGRMSVGMRDVFDGLFVVREGDLGSIGGYLGLIDGYLGLIDGYLDLRMHERGLIGGYRGLIDG